MQELAPISEVRASEAQSDRVAKLLTKYYFYGTIFYISKINI